MNGNVHHFSAGGLYNGLVLLIDDETRTYWDHITGEAVHGKLKGARLDNWPVEMTKVETALKSEPELRVHVSKPPLFGRLMGWAHKWMPAVFPPGFRATMSKPDDRLPEMSLGLGVVTNGICRFYPKEAIGDGLDDDVAGQALHLQVGGDGVPSARWDDGSRPFQLFTRWYGFSFTYPGCEVWVGAST